jgi:ribosomal protein S18 acetylase RimI-like enzyme
MRTRIQRATIKELEELMQWRMKVLHDVFSISDDADTTEFEAANRRYYEEQLPQGRHIACFARQGSETVGCGDICIYNEMPSPDNPTGHCAYLMNIYCREIYRHQGIGREIVGWLVNEARKQGITKIYLETSTEGRKLYESMDFKDMADMMKL